MINLDKTISAMEIKINPEFRRELRYKCYVPWEVQSYLDSSLCGNDRLEKYIVAG